LRFTLIRSTKRNLAQRRRDESQKSQMLFDQPFDTPEGIDTDRLVADPQAIDELSPSVIKEFRANQGKVHGPMEGMPILPLTMTGAKTGRALVRPLCYSHDGERIVVIASYGCAPRSPPWYDNLVANPVGTVEVGTENSKARAMQVNGAERDRLFDAQSKLMPFFADYQNKTKRQILVLTPTRIE
jgi:deazaflavin-dependent oxidoreductase (nitroreductase family)